MVKKKRTKPVQVTREGREALIVWLDAVDKHALKIAAVEDKTTMQDMVENLIKNVLRKR